MGRQVTFYMLDEDERRFLDYVFSINNVKLIFSIFNQPGLHIINNYHILNEMDLYTGEILIWDQSLELVPRYFKARQIKKFCADLGEFRETGDVDYFIDKSNAPVIECARSRINDSGQLVRGRIWVQLHELGDNGFFYKGKLLESLYSQLAKWLRRNLIRVEGYHPYFGKQALEWFKSGGQLLVY